MASMLVTIVGAATVVCSPAIPATCADTNALVWSADFKRRLSSFLGGARGSYLDRAGPVIEQAIEVLGGPPDRGRRLSDGSWLFTACRARNCPEKGAAALSSTGQVLAFGILSFDCRRVRRAESLCGRGLGLTLFVPRRVARAPTTYSMAIIDWARSGAEKDQSASRSPVPGALRSVVTRELP